MRRCFLSCTLARTRSITAATRASFVIIGVASISKFQTLPTPCCWGLTPSSAAQSNAHRMETHTTKGHGLFAFFHLLRRTARHFGSVLVYRETGQLARGFGGMPKKLGCGCLPGTIRTGKGAGRADFDIVQLGHLRGCMVRKLGCTGGLPIPFWLLPYHLSGLFSCETSLDFFRAGDLVSKRVTTIWTIYGIRMTGMAR